MLPRKIFAESKLSLINESNAMVIQRIIHAIISTYNISVWKIHQNFITLLELHFKSQLCSIVT